MTKLQGIRGCDRQRRDHLAAAGQDVQDDVGGVDAGIERFPAGGLDGGQTIGQDSRENGNHLAVTIVGSGQLAPDPRQTCRQHPVFERGAITEGSGLAGEHRHIVPRIVDRLATAKRAGVLADDLAVLADLDALGIGPDLDGAALAMTEYLL